jgi:hypothetical protein
MSGRSIEKKYRVGRRTIIKALSSAWPEPRKQLPLMLRADLRPVPIRGNAGTRLGRENQRSGCRRTRLCRAGQNWSAVALTRRDTAERQAIEDIFAGLRFVRNRMGYKADHDDFLESGAPRSGLVAACTWKQIPDPGLSGLRGHAQEWDLTRYGAYQARLAGRRIADTFSQAAGFLTETSGISQGHRPVTTRTPFA